MNAHGTLTDENGESLVLKLARFLRMELTVIAAGGWPRNPPRVLDYAEDPSPAGTPRSRLTTIVGDVKARLAGRHYTTCFGVVDLTAPPAPGTGTREIAGWGLDVQTTIGSTSKLWGMYAAFQLRDDVRAFVTANPGVAQSDLKSRLQASWRASPIPELKAVGRNGPMPRLEHIFDLSVLPATPPATGTGVAVAASAIDFVGIVDCGIPRGLSASAATATLAGTLETFHQHEYSKEEPDKIRMWEQLATMPFAHRLWLSIAWSDNAAASTVLKDLGLVYVDAVLAGSRLYDSGLNVGARAAMSYGATPDKLLSGTPVWSPGSALNRRISDFKSGQHGKPPRQAGTVRMLLCFVGSLHQGIVISASDSEQMLSLMRPPKWSIGERGRQAPAIGLDGNPMIDEDGNARYVDGVASFVVDAIDDFVDDPTIGLPVADSYRAFAEAAAKLGIASGKLADVAIVDVPTTVGPRLNWLIAFSRCPNTALDGVKPEAYEYDLILKDVITEWMKT